MSHSNETKLDTKQYMVKCMCDFLSKLSQEHLETLCDSYIQKWMIDEDVTH